MAQEAGCLPSISLQQSYKIIVRVQKDITFNLDFNRKERLCFKTAAVAAAKSLQSRPTLCDPIDCSPPGSPVPGILQARTLEWVAISFSNA